MIRFAFVNNQVLQIYRQLPEIRFPLDPKDVIALFSNCRYMSYKRFAAINHCSIDEVIAICESRSGCTHFETASGRYLILCNDVTTRDNNQGRQRWTCGHEIGHIVCDHHHIATSAKLAENSILSYSAYPDLESEADYFAATLLAPFPLFRVLDIRQAEDVKRVFGLSTEASINQMEQYERWKRNRRKTAWENDIVKTYLLKCV